jgi:MFS family permease
MVSPKTTAGCQQTQSYSCVGKRQNQSLSTVDLSAKVFAAYGLGLRDEIGELLVGLRGASSWTWVCAISSRLLKVVTCVGSKVLCNGGRSSVACLSAELAPERKRTFFTSVATCGFIGGALLAFIVLAMLMAIFGLENPNLRSDACVIGVVPLLGAFAVRRYVPTPPPCG